MLRWAAEGRADPAPYRAANRAEAFDLRAGFPVSIRGGNEGRKSLADVTANAKCKRPTPTLPLPPGCETLSLRLGEVSECVFY
jgi:hypothetical protein